MIIRKCLLGGILGVFSISIWAQNARLNLLHEKNRLSFEVRFHEKIVIPSSPLGLNIDNRVLGQELSSAPSLISSDSVSFLHFILLLFTFRYCGFQH